MIVSIRNWYKVLNQVLKLIIKLPGQYHTEKNTFISINTNNGRKCGPPNNIIYCAGILHEFPALGKNFTCTAQERLVIYKSCPLLCLCITKKLLQKIVINFSISVQWHSDCPENLGISYADLVNFAISLLLWVIFPEYLGYSLPCQGLDHDSSQIWWIFGVFGSSSRLCCIL